MMLMTWHLWLCAVRHNLACGARAATESAVRHGMRVPTPVETRVSKN